MVFGCVADESALLAGLREDNPGSIKKWVADGTINLYVPLCTLEALFELRDGPTALNADAKRCLAWLDRITTVTENKIRGRVELQGPDDQYETWAEVEQRISTLVACRDMENSLSSKISHDGDNFNQPGTIQVSDSVRGILNFALWRSTKYEQDSYVVLTDSDQTKSQIEGIGMSAKLLDQFRSIVTEEKKRFAGGKRLSDQRVHEESVTAIRGVLDPDHFGRLSIGQSDAIHGAEDARPRPISNTRTSRKKATANLSNSRLDGVPRHVSGSKSIVHTDESVLTAPKAFAQQSIRGGRQYAKKDLQPAVAPFEPPKPIDPNSYIRPSQSKGDKGRLWEPA